MSMPWAHFLSRWMNFNPFHSSIHRIGWWENSLPHRKPLYLMVKTMVSCRFFPKKPIHSSTMGISSPGGWEAQRSQVRGGVALRQRTPWHPQGPEPRSAGLWVRGLVPARAADAWPCLTEVGLAGEVSIKWGVDYYYYFILLLFYITILLLLSLLLLYYYYIIIIFISIL